MERLIFEFYVISINHIALVSIATATEKSSDENNGRHFISMLWRYVNYIGAST